MIEKLTAALDEARRGNVVGSISAGATQVRIEVSSGQSGRSVRSTVPASGSQRRRVQRGIYDVTSPPVCPHCGSRHLAEMHVAIQYQLTASRTRYISNAWLISHMLCRAHDSWSRDRVVPTRIDRSRRVLETEAGACLAARAGGRTHDQVVRADLLPTIQL